MTSRAKRLTFMIGVVVLVAVIAGSVMAPNTAAAPKQTPRFTITTEEVEVDDHTWGTFVASGAIEGTGTAGQAFGIGMVLVCLSSDAGGISLEVFGGRGRNSVGRTFEVVGASGAYAHIQGATELYSADITYPNGPDGPFVIYRTFKGSVPK